MTRSRKLAFDHLSDEEVETLKHQLEERRKHAILTVAAAQQMLREVCQDYELQMLALAESRKKVDTVQGSKIIKKMKDTIFRFNSNHKGMD